MTHREAIEFFALKIEQQAASKNVTLTDVERQMLRSGVDAEGGENASLYQEFEQESDDNSFEEKTSSLLLDAFERESNDQASNQNWKLAKAALGQYDYYILRTVWRVFPELEPNFAPLHKPSSFLDQVLYLVIALGIVGILLYFVITRVK